MTQDNNRLSRRTILGTTGLTLAGAITAPGMASADEHGEDGKESNDDEEKRERVLEIISGSEWKDKQRTETEKTMEKYGVSEGVTERRLIWYDVDPWKRIEIFRDEVMHDFPAPHPDFFEQFIDYQVPPEKADDLTEYDGSIMFERTTGVMSARCHTEWANFIAINLAHDIITDQKSVAEARQAYGEIVQRKMDGESPAYTQDFQFDLPEGDQQDPDMRTIGNDC